MAANPNDGTQLGSAEIIATEYNDQHTGARRDPNLPVTGYKLPVSKLRTGATDQDGGDVTNDNPLPVASAASIRLQELQGMRERDDLSLRLAGRYGERATLSDARGTAFATRGVR